MIGPGERYPRKGGCGREGGRVIGRKSRGKEDEPVI